MVTPSPFNYPEGNSTEKLLLENVQCDFLETHTFQIAIHNHFFRALAIIYAVCVQMKAL